MISRRQLLSLGLLTPLLKLTRPKYQNYGGTVSDNILATGLPVELLPADLTLTYTVHRVKLELAGLVAPPTMFQSGRLALWFAADPMVIIDSARFNAPPTRPGVSAYPVIWEAEMRAPAMNTAVMLGWLLEGGGAGGGQGALVSGFGSVRFTYTTEAR